MKKNLLIAALAIFGCATGFAQEAEESSTTPKTEYPTIDTWVRSDNMNAHGTEETLQIWTARDADNNITKDFVGLMSFDIDVEENSEISKATLVLHTERIKGKGENDRNLNIYGFEGEVTDDARYDHLSDAIVAARENLIITKDVNGTAGKATFDGGASTNIDDWKTEFDVTEYVKSQTDGKFAFMFTHEGATNDGQSIRIYSKETKGQANVGKDPSVTFAADDLRPKLIIEYTTATGINEVEAVEPVAKGKEGIYTLSGVRVAKADQPGIYIINGKKVLVGRK